MSIKVGLHMHSVREAMRVDPLNAVRECAKVGFKYLELPARRDEDKHGLWYGKTSAEWLETAHACGVTLTGGYVKKPTAEEMEQTIDFFVSLGAQRVVIPIDYFPTRQVLLEKCRLYAEFGQWCRDAGLSLFYENHYHEFQKFGNDCIFDLLLANTNPDLLYISLNSYWAMRGLNDPLEIFSRYKSRIGSLVQQDYPLPEIDKFNMWRFERFHPIAQNIRYDRILQGGEIENIHPVQCELFCEIGTGILSLQPIIDLANDYGNVDHVFLKQDYTRMASEFDSVAESAKNYQAVRGVNWG